MKYVLIQLRCSAIHLVAFLALIMSAAVSLSLSSSTVLSTSSSASSAARELLYQDQQNALERRSQIEHDLLLASTKNAHLKHLVCSNFANKPKSGTGFAASNINPRIHLAREQAKVVKKEGVLRIDNAMSDELADNLKEYVLEQQRNAEMMTSGTSIENKDVVVNSKDYYGVENQRKCRCDLQLSLLKGGFSEDRSFKTIDDNYISDSHPLADALQHLLGTDGTLRYLYENLVTLKGEFYEIAAVITDPGSNRQTIHPDLPFKSKAPLYVIFLALQDITEDMGATTFLLRTHTKIENEKFKSNDMQVKDQQLSKVDCRLSTLKKGDAVLFDARILHCGNANDAIKGSTRALLNFSFRNPKVTGDLGYAGSIRPGYCGKMTLGDVGDALVAYGNGEVEPFGKYGDGLGAIME